MYLKKIEVQGFKSFANKMVFEFDNGITGIVGPNGSGKSNIADAVRWVLGEQSAKQLRGSKMEDIIFAGTQMRKPVSFASVSLTIDNTDHRLDIAYDEVTVSRRVYRSGESEYAINGNPCRLKDINELFYDTGVGKEGYSIIGQGQIDKILSGKPEERRELFDEAAGIVKFKRRKAAAQKSLDSESQNLVRISDILAELEKQVGPLSRQSEKAREYLKLKEELKKYEVNLFLLESDSLKKTLEETSSKLDIVNGDIAESQENFDRIKAVYDEKDAAIQNVSGEIEELTAKHNQAEIDKNKLISQIEILKEQINSANSNDAHIADRIKSLNEQLAERDEEKTNLIKQKFDISEQSDEVLAHKNTVDREVESLNASLDRIMSEIDSKKNAIFDNLNNKSVIQSNIQRYNTMLEQINIRKAELNSRLINYKTDESEFDGAIRSLQNKLGLITREADELSGNINYNETLLVNRRKNKQETGMKLTQSKELLMRNTSRLETLKNIAERYDGYGNSIRKVMECREHNSGVIGVVADIIKTGKKYETAIETALGGTIQNIVTDNEDTAKRMITFLKKNRFGRATFLPLTAVSRKSSFQNEAALGEKGIIGVASSLVHTEEKYRGLTEYLLGRTLVADHIDHAIAVAKKYHYSLRIVTLEGESFSPGGSMTGGAFKNSSNLLGRRR
ncbi:MAG: chromosome segregation protein SMC, partial [Butyrivibrio sp.]